MKKLSDKVFVAGQINLEDFDAITDLGIKTIINNRPDDEARHQPKTAELAEAAKAHNISFHDIPIAGGFSLGQIKACREILDNIEAPTLMFCASGTRSSLLWALVQVDNISTEDILAATASAGYDFRAYATMLESARQT